MGLSGHFYSCMSLMIRDTQVFRGLTGCQRNPGIWGVTVSQDEKASDSNGENTIFASSLTFC